ncbi:MAG TPA: hypothetical protein PLH57_06870, partial [Oligoflexia bacterium]|nr:hypothetical protein [Oligoflexia bacterium]
FEPVFFGETEEAPEPVRPHVNDYGVSLELNPLRTSASSIRLDVGTDFENRLISRKNRVLLGGGVNGQGVDLRASLVVPIRTSDSLQAYLKGFADLGLAKGSLSADEEAHIQLLARIGASLGIDLHNRNTWSVGGFIGGGPVIDVLGTKDPVSIDVLLGVSGTFGGDEHVRRDLAAEAASVEESSLPCINSAVCYHPHLWVGFGTFF